MKRHLSGRSLGKLLSGQSGAHEMGLALDHVENCPECRRGAVQKIAELERAGALNLRHQPVLAAFVAVIKDHTRRVIERLQARGQWAGLASLAPGQRLVKLRTVEALHRPLVVEAGLEDAESRVLSNPALGEELALAIRSLVDLLPLSHCSEQLASEYRARAHLVATNCRRVIGDWQGASALLGVASDLLASAGGEPWLEARLLSVEASIQLDTGGLDSALGLIARAEEILTVAHDLAGLAHVKVQRADALLSGLRSREALARIEEAMPLIEDERLRLLAICVRTESLLRENRATEALYSHEESIPLWDNSPSRRCQRQYIEAMILDSLGSAREAEKLFQDSAEGFEDLELFKNALIVRFALFEAVFKRGSWQKALTICQESLAFLRSTGAAHDQMRQVWMDLIELTRSRQLRVAQLYDLRLYLVLHWVSPAIAHPLNRSKKEGRS